MSGWTEHVGWACAFDRDGVDTDQIIPARFMSTPRSDGYGDYLFHDLRDEDFPLTCHPDTTVLVAGRNFGTGSSREAAVYALIDFGIRAVIAPSFGDIFAANAVNNGLLPARVSQTDKDRLAAALQTDTAPIGIDLDSASIIFRDSEIGFGIDPIWREKLINGWDDIDLTKHHRDAIDAYRAGLAKWRIPAPAG